MKLIWSWLVGFGRFWYRFIVGDDWTIAVSVFLGLVAVNAPDGEVPGRGVGEQQPADAGGGGHRAGFGEGHAELSSAEQVKQGSFLAVVRAGGVTECGPDTAEPFGEQVFGRRVGIGLVPVAPGL